MNGEKIKELREKAGLTREALAKELYVTASIIQSWEEGWYNVPPSSGEIDEMATIFKIDEENLRELLDQDECEDYDAAPKWRFIDYIDYGIKVKKALKKR